MQTTQRTGLGLIPALVLAALMVPPAAGAPARTPATPATAAADTAAPRLTSISIDGNRRTQAYVIERELLCQVGDAARELDFELMKTRLRNINLFSEIEIGVDSLSSPGTTHLLVSVRERPSLLPFPIASNSSKSGLTLGAGCHLLNFRGRHERLSVSASGGGIRGINFSYGNPWVKGNHFSLGLSTSYRYDRNRNNRLDEYDEETFSVGIGTGIYLSKNERWRSSLGASFVSLFIDKDGKTIDPDSHDRVHGIGLGLTYDSRLLYRNPRSAWRVGGGISWFGGALGGTVDYAQYLIDVRRFQPLPFGRTLGLHARLTRRVGTVPEYRLFYLGGSSTVRGYDGGDREGRQGAVAGIEYRHDLTELRSYDLRALHNIDLGLAAALFVDGGVTWNEDATFKWDRGLASAGGGLRLFAPWVEVVRLDLAFTIDGEFQLEIGEGMKF